MDRMEEVTQHRLYELMAWNMEGKLTMKKPRELERLVKASEHLSLENARVLAGQAQKSKTMALSHFARPRLGLRGTWHEYINGNDQ